MYKNHAIENLIRENKIHQIDSVIETSLQDGMVSLDRALATLVRQGHITLQEAFTYAKNQDYLEMLIGKE
jgi:twitching motility protein PilT